MVDDPRRTAAVAAHESRAELVLIDPGVGYTQKLCKSLRDGVDTIHLPADSGPAGGLGGLALALSGRSGIDTLHVLSHGRPGALELTAGCVDAAALAAYPGLVSALRAALSDDAEVVLYGCSVAAGGQGRAFVDAVARALGVRVMASDRPVGAAELGGSWDFPHGARLAFDEAARAAYPGDLAVATFGVVTTLNTSTTLTSNESGTTLSVTRSDGIQMAGVNSGFLDPGVIGNTVSYTVAFSQAVDVTQLQIGEFANLSSGVNYVFTPDSGTAVTIADNSGSIVGSIATLNPADWVGITAFTVSYAGASNWRLGLDNINFTASASAPSALDAPDLLAISDTGTSTTDNVTSSATQQFTGAATSGDSVAILVGGTTLNTVTASGGSWSYTATLAAGSYAITVQASNGGGTGPESDPLNIVVDTTAPSLAAPDLLASSDDGASSTDNVTSDTTPTFSGFGEAGTPVSLLVNGVTAASTVAGTATGAWTLTAATLSAGSYFVQVQGQDIAGNVSSSAGLGVTIAEDVAPSVSFLDLFNLSDSGASSTDNITNDSTPNLSSFAPGASELHILVNGTTVGSATVGFGGSVSFTFASTLTDGSYTITAIADDGSQESAPSAPLNIVVDTVAPSLAAPDLLASSDDGASSTDNVTSDTTPTLTGFSEAGTPVSLLVNGVTAASSFVNTATGTWTLTASTLAAGSYAVQVQGQDVAGNVATSSALGVTIEAAADTTPPTVDDAGSSVLPRHRAVQHGQRDEPDPPGFQRRGRGRVDGEPAGGRGDRVGDDGVHGVRRVDADGGGVHADRVLAI
jgi:hypothetical protein